MKTYIVGGAVRDALLDRPVSDRDWVVVGATPEEMLAAGFRQVGKDFPVFLHPQTREEYALARTERKTAPGYHGFTVHASPEVTLEEDLQRRDLTINAIAQDEDGQLIDPWGGRQDLEARVFRHVSPAFAEDPVRILRVARFAARFPDFRIAPETLALMRAMVAAGEVDHLVAERIWQEFARGLAASRPSRMLEVLGECGALPRLLPELTAPGALDTLHLLDSESPLPEAGRYALLLARLSTPAAEALSLRLKVPNDYRELARLLIAEQQQLSETPTQSAEELLSVLERSDAWRRPGRITDLIACTAVLAPDVDQSQLSLALEAARSIDAGAIAKRCANPADIPAALRAARLDAVRSALKSS
ncbi:multifunctional CCA tRNA nucleotidyl transferase/2'3'-cyclic phosphodiesterase/2'nucleotidase/phosphatase [Niveibacterium terrae]|uniref:multifunctional CCA tRNA nucleotidyl transferase/2'3'-cyclic phosphodiesterase/2'nucleotidase/phosphatase n=1 Tax=Niveibacterium terrae TaxID=3373598 RepID=UPI003A93B1A4